MVLTFIYILRGSCFIFIECAKGILRCNHFLFFYFIFILFFFLLGGGGCIWNNGGSSFPDTESTVVLLLGGVDFIFFIFGECDFSSFSDLSFIIHVWSGRKLFFCIYHLPSSASNGGKSVAGRDD